MQPWDDDGWYVSRAWALIKTGHTFGAVDAGVLANFPGHENYFWLLGSWIQSLFVRFFGPDIFAVRLTSYLFGLALLGIVYALAWRFYSQRVAVLAVLIAAFSFAFIDASHVGRQDVMVAVLGFGSIALYVYQANTRFGIQSVLSGLALGLAFDIHPTVIVFPPVIAALLLSDYGLKAVRLGRTWGFAAGLLAGGIYFAVIHILPNPATYFAISKLQQNSLTTTPPITTFDPGTIANSYIHLASLIRLPLFLLAVIALVIVWRRANMGDKRLVFISCALFISIGALVPLKPDYYGILIAPAIWLLLAASIDSLLPQPGAQPARWDRLRVALLYQLVFILMAANLPLLIKDHNGDYRAAMQMVRDNVPAGKSLIAPMTYWLARPDEPYFVWEQFAFYRRYYPGATIPDALVGMHPDYVVLDGLAVDRFLSPDPNILYDNVMVPESGLMGFLDAHATLVAKEWNNTYAEIRIYRINW